MQQKSDDSAHKNKQEVHQSQPHQLQYSSQTKQVPSKFQIDQIGKDIATLIIPAFKDMINQETDVQYRFDSFHSILNSVKQAEEDMNITQKNKQHTLDWWKVTGQVQEIFNYFQNLISSSYLVFQIDTMADFKYLSKILVDEQELYVEMSMQGKKLITIFQMQNNFHKCQMGFCLFRRILRKREHNQQNVCGKVAKKK
ncbi:unnamed protein product [Paramecium pentaurelia]|uniref:Uncharacterized protein n=1 Tax=Paramecium pentaurelia TaxID=43138 RepID=A0A8S1WXA1_9CILI|nr:unnamed protein product [Paramecium pentaurelia]